VGRSKKTLTLLLGLFTLLMIVYLRTERSEAQETPQPKQTPAVETPASQAQPLPQATPPVDTQQHSFFDATSKWPSTRIYVCWENPDETYRETMNLVRQSVVESWEAASALRFTGWQKCGVENRGIRILIDDSGPHTKGLGLKLDGKPAGMVLNFTFNNWSPSCKTKIAYCTKSIAVHEFGHAIGFAHEQNRPDAPGECQALAQGSNGTVLLTPYDPQSVMNYCNEQYNNNGILSEYDTQAVKNIYGPTPADRSRSIGKTRGTP
jgi:hypothetical protein